MALQYTVNQTPATGGNAMFLLRAAMVAAGGTAQVLTASKQGRYPLRRMLDTVSAHGGAELRVTVGARTAVIARISASAPAGDPWLSG